MRSTRQSSAQSTETNSGTTSSQASKSNSSNSSKSTPASKSGAGKRKKNKEAEALTVDPAEYQAFLAFQRQQGVVKSTGKAKPPTQDPAGKPSVYVCLNISNTWLVSNSSANSCNPCPRKRE